MLKRANRITSELFKQIKRANKEHTKNFLIQYVENKNREDTENKFAIIITKKICPSAVCRNKIKRKIQSAIIKLNLFKPTNAPKLIAIYTKKNAENLQLNNIVEELRCSQVFHTL